MEDMEKEYTTLFNVITDTISQLSLLREKLILAQQQAEEMYINRGQN